MENTTPLAEILRPKTLDDFIGQEHLVGENGPLRYMIKAKRINNLIFWGPPGVGKTTLAQILAKSTETEFVYLSAVSASKQDIKTIVETENSLFQGKVLFLDEIHRFNKAQQDFLLPFVESGRLQLIGATTENPSFEVISPLLSRTQVYVLKELLPEQLEKIIKKAEKYLKLKVEKKAREYMIKYANGDGRKIINLLESAHQINTGSKITLEIVKNALQSAYIRYDKGGEEHYNTISAFIKSMRASDVNAALYYLARMVAAGEDPLFIARRMVVFASEDVASPTALVVANAIFRACETIGYPECQENLAAGVVFLAQAKKDRRAYDAYMKALADVKVLGNLPIPLNIRNAPTKLMKDLGYSKGYEKYSNESLLPNKLKNKKYYDENSLGDRSE